MSDTDTELGGSGGGIVREVLTRQGRSKLDVGSDRDFYAYPRLVCTELGVGGWGGG